MKQAKSLWKPTEPKLNLKEKTKTKLKKNIISVCKYIKLEMDISLNIVKSCQLRGGVTFITVHTMFVWIWADVAGNTRPACLTATWAITMDTIRALCAIKAKN